MQWWPINLLVGVVLTVLVFIFFPRLFLLESRNRATPSKTPGVDQALSLYTFYEGRVQSGKSILIGILTGILSLQIPILLSDLLNKPFLSFMEVFPVILLCIPALLAYSSLKLHMMANDRKSKIYQKPLKYRITYNPPLSQWECKIPHWLREIYKIYARLRLPLEGGLLVAICFLSLGSLLLWYCRSGIS
jgi:hypothetical protein